MNKIQGIKIAKEGFDVTSTNPEAFKFHSDYSTRNIKVRDSLQITTSGDDYPQKVVATYLHNFGYIPQFIAYTKSYLATILGKFSSAEYVNFDYVVDTDAVEQNFYEELRAYTTDTELVIEANLMSYLSGWQSGIENTYTVDFVLFMEEAVPLP